MRIKAMPRAASDYLLDRADAVWQWYLGGSLRFRVATGFAVVFGLLLLATWAI